MGTAQKSTGHPGQEWALDQREKGRRDLPMDCEGKGLKATAGDRRGQGRPYTRLGSTYRLPGAEWCLQSKVMLRKQLE